MPRCLALILFCVPFTWPVVRAQLDTKPLIEDVAIDEKLGQRIDPNLTFVDTEGRQVTLGELLRDRRPVIFAPVYYSCPQLCTLVLNGVKDLIDEMDLRIGRDYRVVNISFDPDNTPALAKAKKANYLNALELPENARDHWYFLTGNQEAITAFTDQIGFRYKKVDDQFSHASVLVVVSPEGVISRYIYGVNYPPQQARFSLVDAADGKVGSTLDRILIYCFKYDPLAGKYVPYAWGIMRIGALLTVVFMAAGGLFLWRKELFQKRRLRQHV